MPRRQPVMADKRGEVLAGSFSGPYFSSRTTPERCCLKKYLKASRPCEHPPVRGGNVKAFRWDCKDNTSSGHLIGFPDGSNLGSTV